MRPIWEAYMCHIDITNVCPLACIYCDRYIRHIRKDQRFFMSLEQVENALKSLEGWRGYICIMGGEPTVHPQFDKICKLLHKYYHKGKYQLLTMGGKKFEKHQELIKETFFHVAINAHNESQLSICLHQPITMAVQDVVEDEIYRSKLIDECWVQKAWCPTIGPKGAFFCEVAYGIDMVLDGPGGYPVEPGWWGKTPEQFQDQIDWCCKYCGMPIPMKGELLKTDRERISPGNLKLFKKLNLPRLSDKDVILFDRKLSIDEMEKIKPNWDPRNYRQDIEKNIPNGWKKRKLQPLRDR